MEGCTLPIEIILQILSYSAKAQLKTFRQCCWTLSEELTPILFRELVVVPYVSSIEGITKLSFNPSIRKAVKHIRYDVNCLFDPSVDLEGPAKDSEVLSQSKQLQQCEQRYPGFIQYLVQLQEELFRPPVLGDFENSLAVSSNGWIMSNSGSELNLLSYLPYFFPHVEEMTLSSKGWSTEALAEPDQTPPPLPYFYQKWFQSHKRDSRIPDLDLSSPYFANGGPEVISYRAECLLLALCNHSQKRLAVKMEGLLGRSFGGAYGEEVVEIWARDCLRNCKSLTLDFFEQKDAYRQGEKYDWLAYLITQSKEMSDLTLQFNDDYDGPQQILNQLAGAKKLPPITSITLGHLSVSGNTLIAMLRRFKPTLHNLKFDTIRLRSGTQNTTEFDSWTLVLKTLADEFNLVTLELDGLLRGYRQDWTVNTPERLHEAWQHRTSTMSSAGRMGALQHMFGVRSSANSLSQLVFEAGMDETVLYDEEDCLASRVKKYVTKQGDCPQELLEFEAMAQGPRPGPAGRQMPIGDYSLRMMISA